MITSTKPTTPEVQRHQPHQDDLANHQHAHNALATALWHVARGDLPAAMSRIRRAQAHLSNAMEGGAA